MPRANKGQQKVPILKKTTGLCPSRSYYPYVPQVIEERSFHGCRAVQSLSLSHSGLQHIQAGALRPLASLTRLELAHNSLTNLTDWHQVEGLARLQAGHEHTDTENTVG